MVQILESHPDEVWFLQFSHNDTYLASFSKDQTSIKENMIQPMKGIEDQDWYKGLSDKWKDWADLWRPELAGRVSIVNSPREVVGAVLKYMGV